MIIFVREHPGRERGALPRVAPIAPMHANACPGTRAATQQQANRKAAAAQPVIELTRTRV
jgi:hypothetical protein